MIRVLAVWVILFGAAAPCLADGGTRDRFISRARQLTFDGRRAGEGYFSSDSKKIIMQTERYPGNPFFQIYTLDLESGRSRLISPGMGRTTCSYFRPGTDRVLFASTHLDPQAKEKQKTEYAERAAATGHRKRWIYDEHFDIFSTDSRGRKMRRLTDTFGYDAEGAYSPDGKLIVFSSNRHAYPAEKLTPEARKLWGKDRAHLCEIYVMNADGSGQRRLTDWLGNDGGPFFTFDGERIIWRHFDESGMLADVYTVKIDGSDRRRLTDFECMSWSPYMHPSGQYAIFTCNKHGMPNFELFIVDALGEKQPIRVSYTDGFDGLPVFAPDGKTFSWTSSRNSSGKGQAQLFIADWDHQAALAAVHGAPPRGVPEPKPNFAPLKNAGWELSDLPKIKPGFEPAITRDDLYQHVKYLASDELEGRMTGKKGARLAGEYIAARFKEAGLEPLGNNGTYFQEFPFPAGVALVREKNAFEFHMAPQVSGIDSLEVEKGFRPLPFTANAAVDGELVFAGYGLIVPEDPGQAKYDSYAGLEVKGKIVLVLDDVPQKLGTEQRIRFSHYSSPRYKAMQAKQRGAKGFLLVVGPNTPGAGELLPLSRTASDAGIVAASVSIEVANRLLFQSKHTIGDFQDMLDGGELPATAKVKTELASILTLKTHLERKVGHCRNVVGLLPAVGDDEIADEYVMVGAHYDHIGHGEAGGSRAIAGEEGQIHNGADDNASGDAVVLELAAALADVRKHTTDQRSRRGIIFACWSGEEIGIIGSAYFAKHPPCPLGRIAAYVNLDMVGRLREGRLILQGLGSSPQWRRWAEKINILEPLDLTLQDDPYLPTDTTAFYPTGIPIVAFFTDVHDDYNRPTDDADTLNYTGMGQVSRFAERLVADLACSPSPPSYAEIKRAMPKGGGGGGRQHIYTGTIPDFGAGDAPGMKISGVQGGSPAEKAGMKPGDVIIKFAGQEIRSLQDYSTVLGAVKPDQPVEIIVLRNNHEVRLEITPTVRK
ncbi:MAG: M28 family peptidase [Phycisphaerae bacterium]|nr:M28 family peptidase [Phycisphaerae bacterium]